MIAEDGSRFLPEEQRNFSDPTPTLIRQKLVGKGQLIIRPFRGKSINKQLYVLLTEFALNGDTPTSAEVLRILQGNTSKEEPTEYEKELIAQQLSKLREWLSDMKLPGHLITYVKRMIVEGYRNFGIQSVIEPIWNKVEYDKAQGKHIRKVGGSILERDAENLTCLNQGEKKLKKMAMELHNQIAQEIQEPTPLIAQPKRKRKAKK
jgi:hypothetical protein